MLFGRARTHATWLTASGILCHQMGTDSGINWERITHIACKTVFNCSFLAFFALSLSLSGSLSRVLFHEYLNSMEQEFGFGVGHVQRMQCRELDIFLGKSPSSTSSCARNKIYSAFMSPFEYKYTTDSRDPLLSVCQALGKIPNKREKKMASLCNEGCEL